MSNLVYVQFKLSLKHESIKAYIWLRLEYKAIRLVAQLGLEGRAEQLRSPVDVGLPKVLPPHSKWLLLLVEETLLDGSVPRPDDVSLEDVNVVRKYNE